MSDRALPRPADGEYNDYYGRYVALVPDGDVVETLEREWKTTRARLAAVPAERETYRYAEGKWSVREVVGHLLDVERAFAFRGLWIARGAAGELPSFDQDAWVVTSGHAGRTLASLLEEWDAVRRSTVLLFGSLDGEAGARRGRASGFEFTVRAFPWIIAGHELYHRELLARDYGVGA